jgi:hypothetical protein
VTRGCFTSNSRVSDPVMVPDAHLCVGQAVDREILAKLAVEEVAAAKLSLS